MSPGRVVVPCHLSVSSSSLAGISCRDTGDGGSLPFFCSYHRSCVFTISERLLKALDTALAHSDGIRGDYPVNEHTTPNDTASLAPICAAVSSR